MAEEGVLTQAGLPMMGKGAGGKSFIQGVSRDYAAVAASQTTAALGATGAKGDYLEGLLIIPATTTPGAVTLFDNATAIMSFPGGTTTVVPFYVPIKAFSTSGKWNITTGTNVSVLASGSFT